jgi:hypothetical protein
MLLPFALGLLILFYGGLAALPWYRVPIAAPLRVVFDRIARLSVTIAALRLAAFAIVFNAHPVGWIQLLGYLLVLLLYPELALFTPTRTLSSEQRTIMMITIVIGSFVLSAVCVLILRWIRAKHP